MKNSLFTLLFLCLGMCGASAQDFLMQNGSINTCSGTFYDSGGANDDYSSNENLTYTICPDDSSSERIVVTFSEFQTPGGTDVMTVYDGADTSGTQLAQLTGNVVNPADGDAPLELTASDENTSGCLTFVFSSDQFLETDGWVASLSCREPCALIDNSFSVSPSIFVDPNYRVCKDDEITFDVSSALSNGDPSEITYSWDFDDGNTATGSNVTNTFTDPGLYIVELTSTFQDCDPVIDELQVQVGTEPSFSLSASQTTICEGDQVQLTGSATPVPFEEECALPVSGTTFLPDGNGSSYFSSITVDCFDDDQTLNDASELLNVCLRIEHSFLGDLDIILIAPDGTQIFLKTFAEGGGATYLGSPIDNDATNNPGQGFQYCFSNSASTLLVNGPTQTAGTPPGPSISPGTYAPSDDFNNLVGVPLNGDWTIQITDNLSIDNGFIFQWFLDFDPSIIPPDASFTPSIADEDKFWTDFPDQGNTITVTPPNLGQNCYVYQSTDNFGCTYTETICVDVEPNPFVTAVEDLFKCGDPTDIEFDLTENDPNVLGAQNQNIFAITYHNTQNDAFNGTNPIPNPETYPAASIPETIYVRIQNQSGLCFDVNSFELLQGSADAGTANDLEECAPVGTDLAIFDLTENDSDILGSASVNDNSVSYYLSEQDAIDEANIIQDPESYQSTSENQEIWFRLDNNDTSCFDYGSFFIESFHTPAIQQTPSIDACHDDFS
ncbi:MAG: PKD domain-containing protein, partial [Psychroflexus sp.]|nr:PKD domain-containing protein [Psychroflexus sp.]